MQGNVEDYLAMKLTTAKGKNADLWRELHDLYTRRLWHLLTNKLKDCVSDDSFTSKEDLIEIREKFIREFEHRVNPLTLTEIILIMARLIPDKEKAIKLMESIKTVIKNHIESNVLYLVGICELILSHRDNNGRCHRIQEVKQKLEEAEQLLNSLPGVSSVHGDYYKVSSIYYQEIGDHSAYYRDALRYLGCIDIQALSGNDKAVNAFALGVAALLGENVYNFGELLAHPILESLKGTENQFVVALLYAFNSGNIDEFERLRPQWSRQDDLVQQKTLLERKIRLLALMELAFTRTAQNRRLNFSEIEKAARIDAEQVEYLSMKALSLGLIKGLIDEVDQVLDVTWVQPRVLDKGQVSKMASRFGYWSQDVKQVSNLVQDQAKEILTHY